MRAAFLAAIAALIAPFVAAETESAALPAEPIVKIINFTADWCPNCQVVDPRIEEALERFPAGEIEYVELDLTQSKRTDEETRTRVFREAIQLADRHQAGYLWDWYGGFTGISVLIAADNGEPISCVTRILSVDDIEFRIQEARILALRAPAGMRKPQGPACPPPMNM